MNREIAIAVLREVAQDYSVLAEHRLRAAELLMWHDDPQDPEAETAKEKVKA